MMISLIRTVHHASHLALPTVERIGPTPCQKDTWKPPLGLLQTIQYVVCCGPESASNFGESANLQASVHASACSPAQPKLSTAPRPTQGAHRLLRRCEIRDRPSLLLSGPQRSWLVAWRWSFSKNEQGARQGLTRHEV